MEDTECISRFFNEEENLRAVSPQTLQQPCSPSKSLDASQDLSQTSIESEEFSLSQLTIDEQEPIDIQPFFNITPRQMPVSPHYVIERVFFKPLGNVNSNNFPNQNFGENLQALHEGFF
ncbi:hypothetical protein PYW08_008305 [Mythimna loreyi]|uniref:Uncharacterized protein n=1 Tax=Mythimna loreyi TaxID=667449 RepID=A0ACC2QF11_9NEOP|nr:hypothetical protein PYW08_008305 [Mythimna loreyi]